MISINASKNKFQGLEELKERLTLVWWRQISKKMEEELQTEGTAGAMAPRWEVA